MSPRIRRLVVTTIVLGLAAGVVLVSIFGPESPTGKNGAQPGAETATAAAQDPTPQAETPPLPPPQGAPASVPPPQKLGALNAVWVARPNAPPRPLGSLDPGQAKLFIEFSTVGAGIERITLSEFWQTAAQGRMASAHYEAVKRGNFSPPSLPPESQRYVLQTAQPRFNQMGVPVPVPALAVDTIVINGEKVRLSNEFTNPDGTQWTLWSETAPGQFEASIVDADQRPIARITREFIVGAGYDIVTRQGVINQTDAPIDVQWIQYGPGDLTQDRSRYMDRRRLRFGYLPDPVGFPRLISSSDGDLLFERGDALKKGTKAKGIQDLQLRQEMLTLWPNDLITVRFRGGDAALYQQIAGKSPCRFPLHALVDVATPRESLLQVGHVRGAVQERDPSSTLGAGVPGKLQLFVHA